jgi:hypothetical protein
VLDRALRSLATPVRVVVLVLIAFRFHGSWVGLTVVAASAFLLFGADRALRRWAGVALGRPK